jgi:hypothetical protein
MFFLKLWQFFSEKFHNSFSENFHDSFSENFCDSFFRKNFITIFLKIFLTVFSWKISRQFFWKFLDSFSEKFLDSFSEKFHDDFSEIIQTNFWTFSDNFSAVIFREPSREEESSSSGFPSEASQLLQAKGRPDEGQQQPPKQPQGIPPTFRYWGNRRIRSDKCPRPIKAPFQKRLTFTHPCYLHAQRYEPTKPVCRSSKPML